MLCAEAALRSGAGLVDVATRAAHVPAMLSRRPEAMAHAVDAAADLDGLVDVADVVAIGPGLGQDAWGDELFSALIDNAKPLVVDADRSEEHTSELQSLMRNSYAVFCLK